MLDFGLALGRQLSSQQAAECIQALFGGEIVEARGWAVVQLSHDDTLCRQPNLWKDASAATPHFKDRPIQGEAACREARSLRRFAGAWQDLSPRRIMQWSMAGLRQELIPDYLGHGVRGALQFSSSICSSGPALKFKPWQERCSSYPGSVAGRKWPISWIRGHIYVIELERLLRTFIALSLTSTWWRRLAIAISLCFGFRQIVTSCMRLWQPTRGTIWAFVETFALAKTSCESM